LRKYFYNGWNLIELLDIILYLVVIVLYIKYLLAPERYSKSLEQRVYSPDMESLAATALAFYNVIAINVILTTFRTFKYLRLNHRLYLLWKALRHAGADLIGFLLIFLIFIFGFIFMGWLSFGSDLAAFNNFSNSFGTCWNFIIGNPPDYGSMFDSNRVLGPVFFVLFTIFIFFILANMFIAILSNSFNDVNSNKEDDGKLKDIIDEKIAELVSGFKKMYFSVTNKNLKPRPIKEILDTLQNPLILERPNLTRDDVAHAIGSNAKQTEVDELYGWIKRLESKEQNKKAKEVRNSTNIVEDLEVEIDLANSKEVPRTYGKKSGANVMISPPPLDTKEALRELQAEVKEIKQLLQAIVSNSNKNI